MRLRDVRTCHICSACCWALSLWCRQNLLLLYPTLQIWKHTMRIISINSIIESVLSTLLETKCCAYGSVDNRSRSGLGVSCSFVSPGVLQSSISPEYLLAEIGFSNTVCSLIIVYIAAPYRMRAVPPERWWAGLGEPVGLAIQLVDLCEALEFSRLAIVTTRTHLCHAVNTCFWRKTCPLEKQDYQGYGNYKVGRKAISLRWLL